MNAENLIKELDAMHPVVNNFPSGGSFTVWKGNITEAEVDVIVCPVGKNFSSGAQVASNLFHTAGDELLKDYYAIDKSLSCALIPLGAKQKGRLKADAVCFVPVPDMDADALPHEQYSLLRRSYYLVYDKISKCGLYEDKKTVTVAFPLIGAGAAGYPAQLSAEAAFDVYLSYYNSFKPSKRKIYATLATYTDSDHTAVENARCWVMFKEMIKARLYKNYTDNGVG